MKKRLYGFTITELVIVIAVVAVMAAVLVPIFSDIVGKANGLGDAVSARKANINAIIDGSETQTSTSASEGTTFAAAEEPQLTDILLMSSETLTTPNVTYKLITNEALEEVTLELAETSIYRLVIDAPNVQKIYIKYEEGASGEAQLGYVDILHTAPSSTHISVCVSRLDLSDGRVVIESGALVERVAVLPTKNASATVELFSPTQIAATFKCNGDGTADAICIIDHTDASSVVMEADDEAISHGTTTSLSLISSSENEVPFAVSDKNEAQSSFFEGKQINTTVTDGGVRIASLVTIGQEKIEQITISDSEITLDVGGTFTLTSAVLPEGADGDIEWRSSDESVAKVDGGKVTALKLGSATISASVGGKSAICKVHVGAASIGDVYYATFSDAVDAARDGDTLVLLKNATAAQTNVSKSFILDLNGKTLSTTGKIVLSKSKNVTLTIDDQSKEKTGEITSSVIAFETSSGSSLVINSGTIKSESISNYAVYNNGGAVEINGGYIYGFLYGIYSTSKITVNGGTIEGGTDGINTISSVAVAGGTIIGSTNGINQTRAGKITVSGGNIISDKTGIYSNSGEVYICSSASVTGKNAVDVKTGKLMESSGTLTGEVKEHK